MNPQDEALSVTQADRDAAADTLFHVDGDPFVAHIRDGMEDDSYLVQAFARHRLSHSTPGDAEVREAGDLKHKLWMIISHATGGELSNEADVDRSTNDICVRISAFRNKLYQAGKDAAASSLATPSGRAQGEVEQ